MRRTGTVMAFAMLGMTAAEAAIQDVSAKFPWIELEVADLGVAIFPAVKGADGNG